MFDYGTTERAAWIALKTKLAYNCPFSIEDNELSLSYNNCEIALEYELLTKENMTAIHSNGIT